MNKLYTSGNADFLFSLPSGVEAWQSSSRHSPLTINQSLLSNTNQSVSLKATSMYTSKTNNMKNNFISGIWQGFVGKKVLLFLMFAFIGLQGWGQRTIFSENMGTPSGNTAIASNTFQNATLTFSGNGDVRTSNASSGYTGASAGGNVFLTTTGTPNFQIAGVSTVNYSSLSLSFGIYKSTTAGTGSDLIVEVSTDGTSFSTLSVPALASGAGTVGWYLRTALGTIPSTANLRIRFRQAGSTTQYRIDDVILTGTPANPTTTSLSPSSATAGGIAFALTVNGTNFISGVSTVTWNGVNRTTTFVSSSELTAAITAVDISTAGSATVGVTTTGAATAASNTQSFTINASVAPVLTSTTLSGALTTTYGTAGSPASFTAAGTNLTGSITATPQTNYEIATTSGGTYGTSGISVTSGTQLFVRLAATAPAAAYNNATAVVLSGGGAASTANVSTTSATNTVTPKALTITGLTGTSKSYDGLTTASFTGTPAYSGGFANGESYSTVSGIGVANFATASVGTSKVVNITGYAAPTANYSITQPTLSADVIAIPLTIVADNASKSFNTTLTTPVTGSTAFSSSGLVNSETIGSVTISYTAGTSASAAVGLYSGTVVPSAATGGTFSTGNYSPITYTSGDLTIIPASVVLAGWDFSAATNYGISPQTPGSTSSNATVTGLVRSSTIDISNAAAPRGYGGAGFNYTTAAAAITATRFFTFTIKPASGFLLSLSSINPFYYRRSSSGATNVQIQYSLDGTNFTDIGTVSLSSSSNSGALASATLLNGISNLQNLTSSTTVTLRFVPYGASGATGTFYFYDAVNTTANDLVLNGSVVTAPAITGAATATAFTTTYGTASAAQTFAVSGANLTANLVATAPTGFEVSSNGTTYGSTATFTQTSGIASGTLSIRLSATATATGTYNAQNIVLSSTNATSVNIITAASGNTVLAKALTITGLTGVNKIYDGTVTATVTGTGVLNGVIAGDVSNVILNGSTGSYSFSNANVGSVKAITASGFTISGTSASNYTLPLTAAATNATANIIAKALSITGLTGVDKTYNGTATATVTGTGVLNGVLSADVSNVTLDGSTGSYSFSDANVGSGKAITASGFTISGTSASNYTLSLTAATTNATADITATSLLITGVTANDKVYDGTTTTTLNGTPAYSGLQNGESFSVAGTPVANFNSASVGTGKPVTVTGYTAPSANYTVTQPTGLTAAITGLSITGADFRSKSDGNFSDPNIWEYDLGGDDWVDANAAPLSTNKVDIFHAITLDQNFTVGSGKRLTLRTEPASPGSLVIGPTANLEMTDASSAINFNGRPVTVKSTDAGTGSIGKMLGSLTNATNVTVERFIPANATRAYRLLTSPTSGQTIKASWQENQTAGLKDFGTIITSNAAGGGFDAVTPGASMFSYDPSGGTGTSGSYVPVANTDPTLISSQPGWLIYIRGDRTALPGQSTITPTTLRTKGTLTQGSVTTDVNANQNALVGNPYASAIDLRNVTLEGSLAGSVLVVWDPKLGTQGGYVNLTPNTTTGQVTSYTATPRSSGTLSNNAYINFNNTIQSGQAFFVQGGSTNGRIIINENSKVAGSVTGVFRPAIPSTPAGTEQRLFADLYSTSSAGSTLLDGIFISLDDAHANAVDNFDGRKRNNFNENLGIRLQGVNLAVEKRKPFVSDDTVFFSTTSLRRTTYQLSFNTENLDPNVVATLEDNYLDTKTLVNPNGNSTYDFTVDANAASAASDRFRVVFKALESGPLPVSFTSIKAAQQNNDIALEWKVGSQLNIARYEVEKSVDGRNFVKVAGVDAVTATTYNWLDVNALQGANFYRVRAIDNNATFKYTQIVKITLGRKGSAITVSPNPVQGNTVNLQFTNQQAGKYRINLINAAGQLMYSNILQHSGGSSSQTFTLSSPTIRGVYQLEIIAPDKTRRAQKLIIE